MSTYLNSEQLDCYADQMALAQDDFFPVKYRSQLCNASFVNQANIERAFMQQPPMAANFTYNNELADS